MKTLVINVNVFVDTEIWSFAQKTPVREKFEDELEYKKFSKAHVKAKKFLKRILIEEIIYMSLHQVAEIFHVLGFRGYKLPMDFVVGYVNDLLLSERIVKIPVTVSHVKEALKLSKESGIHVWDFLCIIPIKEYIDIIYTVDKHFLHETFQKLGIKIENPLKIWIKV